LDPDAQAAAINIADFLPKRSLEKNLDDLECGFNFRDAV